MQKHFIPFKIIHQDLVLSIQSVATLYLRNTNGVYASCMKFTYQYANRLFVKFKVKIWCRIIFKLDMCPQDTDASTFCCIVTKCPVQLLWYMQVHAQKNAKNCWIRIQSSADLQQICVKIPRCLTSHDDK